MVPATTALLAWGPPAWLLVVVIAMRRAPWSEAPRTSEGLGGLSGLAVYALLVLAQHALHSLCARGVLAHDLARGELTREGWARKVGRGKSVVLVALEGDADGRVVGTVAVRLTDLCGRHGPGRGCCSCRRAAARSRRGDGGAASLWHAAVDPRARNRGTATALLREAEAWASERRALTLEALCLSGPAKAACWNAGFQLWNDWSGRLPLVPGVFLKQVPAHDRARARAA
ncbi:unnamed protein product [Prorocentrum cordatum]|uniref:N-acetyltransferase domain-containing protein n=1 Tax=Prorocentrum cordatum TaxID=2364126 RepID=A0ABN9Y0P7_9DINO|nr:unnamed protein product [Polarella glacialis]